MGKKRKKLGDIFAIPLPNDTYAFGRLFKENTLAIFKERSENINEIPKQQNYDFFVAVYTDLLNDGVWSIIGNIPFTNEEDAWRPPTYIKDPFNGKYFIYEHAEIRPSSEEECKGLEVTAVWDRHHLIDRLMGTKKWL